MNEPYDWDRLQDPSVEELDTFNSAAMDSERSIYWGLVEEGYEPALIEWGKWHEETLPYLEELAQEARIVLGVLMLEFFQENSHIKKMPSHTFLLLRSRAVRQVMPRCPSQDIYFEVSREVKSIMQKKAAAERKKKLADQAARKRSRHRPTTAEIKARRKEMLAKAEYAMLHGTNHGEFYLRGVTPCALRKKPYRRPLPYLKGTIPRRTVIPKDEQLGTILEEAEVEVRLHRTYGFDPEEWYAYPAKLSERKMPLLTGDRNMV